MAANHEAEEADGLVQQFQREAVISLHCESTVNMTSRFPTCFGFAGRCACKVSQARFRTEEAEARHSSLVPKNCVTDTSSSHLQILPRVSSELAELKEDLFQSSCFVARTSHFPYRSFRCCVCLLLAAAAPAM